MRYRYNLFIINCINTKKEIPASIINYIDKLAIKFEDKLNFW